MSDEGDFQLCILADYFADRSYYRISWYMSRTGNCAMIVVLLRSAGTNRHVMRGQIGRSHV